MAELLDRILLPPTVWTTFPAGWGKLTKGVGGRLRGSGLKPGMPDILIFSLEKTTGIELKAPGRSPSAFQRTMFAALQAVGVRVHVCFSLDDVLAVLLLEDIPFRAIDLYGRRTEGTVAPPGERQQTGTRT